MKRHMMTDILTRGLPGLPRIISQVFPSSKDPTVHKNRDEK
jgi:hypothetical protein